MEDNQVALQLKLTEVVEEYNAKVQNIKLILEDFESAGKAIDSAATIKGTFGNVSFDTGRVYDHQMKASLLKSAWLFVYKRLQIERVATAKDKKLFAQSLEHDMPEFTLANIRATFGDYLIDPRTNILRGLAEVFSTLDTAYKSHEKVRIGVKGLPKRIIISGLNGYGYGWGWDKITDVINALSAYQGLPMVSHKEIQSLLKGGELLENKAGDKGDIVYHNRGVWLKRFKNGNGHLFFSKIALQDINAALGEYYGAALADETGERSDTKSKSTSVSKDLQYYPTPTNVVDSVLRNLRISDNEKILEPSCGCGRIMDGIKAKNNTVKLLGFEYDAGRANQARSKGHNVIIGNFLETIPTGDFDKVVMNPPFAGNHYFKHIQHAMEFLKTDGELVAIVPSTARYDHGLLDNIKGRSYWIDLPTGSFRDSGTNVSTSMITIIKNY